MNIHEATVSLDLSLRFVVIMTSSCKSSVCMLIFAIQVNNKVDGKAPIHWAIQANNVGTLKCLLEHHADVNILVS